MNPPRDAPLPVVPGAELFVVDPDGVSPFFEVGLETVDERLVEIMAVTEKDALGAGCKSGRGWFVNRRSLKRLTAISAEPFIELGLKERF